MRSTILLGIAGLSLTLLGCQAPSFSGPEVQPFELRATPTGPSAPLIVLDGRRIAPGTSLASLRASDIAGVEVFKGGLALEKYGEAGRAGVIFITTKARPRAHR